ncbi:AAA family ATPase [Streptomyces sp. NPDC127117]|uniref:helix-turn-helix transcriptional regulator n=1 Tax=Streptomyces sp. NPDC127117 TaxID=3345368 RepID=UPI003632E777
MNLVERDSQWAALGDLFSAAVRREGGTAVLHGPPGCGRSELLSAFSEHLAQETGAVVLRAVGTPTESHVPGGTLRQLFAGPHRIATELRERAGALLGVAPAAGAGATPDGVALPSWVTAELCALIDAASSRDPLLIAIDDLHHADETSYRFLLRLMHTARTSRVLVVVTERTSVPAERPLPELDLLALQHAHRIPLPMLSPAGVRRMLADRLAPDEADHHAERIHRTSGGSPLLVRALMAELPGLAAGLPADGPAADRTGPETLAATASFARTALSLLHRSGPTILNAARAAAVLGSSSSELNISRVLGLDRDEGAAALEALGTMGVFREDRFAHPAVGTAVLQDPSFAERDAMALAAARVLYECGAADITVAQHVVAAGRAEPWARLPLIHAAEEMLRTGHARSAVRCLELAHAVSPTGQDRARTMAYLAHATGRDNPSEQTMYNDPLLGHVRDGSLTGRCALTLVRHLLRDGREQDAVEVIQRVGAGRSKLDLDTTTALEQTRQFLRVYYPSTPWPLPDIRTSLGSRHAQRRGTARSFTGSSPQHGAVLLKLVLDEGPQEIVVQWGRQILEAIRPDERSLETAVAVLQAFTYSEHYDLAEQWGARLQAVASDHGIPRWSSILTAVRAETAIRRGDPPASLTMAETALKALSPELWGLGVGLPVATLLQAYTDTGRHDEAQALLLRQRLSGVARTRFGLMHQHARGRHYLGTGRHYAALDAFLACGETAMAWGFDVPTFLPWRSDAAFALLEMGEADEARRLIHEQEQRPGGASCTVRGIGLRALARAGRAGDRLALLRESATHLSNSGNQLELARTLVALAHSYRHSGDHSKAEMVAHQARFRASECGASPLLGELDAASDSGPALCAPLMRDPTSSELLTDAERRVAELAALGSSNREIARKLHVTVSTVEQHLTRIYRKLRIKRRSELPRRLTRNRFAQDTGRFPEAVS